MPVDEDNEAADDADKCCSLRNCNCLWCIAYNSLLRHISDLLGLLLWMGGCGGSLTRHFFTTVLNLGEIE